MNKKDYFMIVLGLLGIVAGTYFYFLAENPKPLIPNGLCDGHPCGVFLNK